MNICYDYQMFARQEYGGVSRYIYEIASRISKLDGHSVRIIAPLYVNEYLRHGDVQTTGIYCPYIPHTYRVFINPINKIFANLLCKPLRGVDIFHETYYSMRNYKPRKAIRLVTVHDMTHEKFREQLSLDQSILDIKAYAIRRADHLICVSENTRKDLIEILGIKKAKTSVVWHGYSLRANNRQVHGLASNRPYIFYVGVRREQHKNFEALLRAYANSHRLKKEFALYCFGGGRFSTAELALIKSLGLRQDSIKHFSGDDSILAGLYASATAFVYPSLYEGFGIPPLEAMSFGCPVVCSNTSSLPEVVADAAEMFDPTDEAAIRLAIERVVFSTEYREDLARRGRARLARFSWDKCARDTLDVYQKLMSDS